MDQSSMSEVTGELNKMIMCGFNVRDLHSKVKVYKESGISQEEVQRALEAMRKEAKEDAVEDVILELLDFTSGFCSPHYRVW